MLLIASWYISLKKRRLSRNWHVINMAKKLTEKALVKKLDTMSRVELTKIIVDFYKTNKSIEEGLSLMILGEEYGSALLEKYKK